MRSEPEWEFPVELAAMPEVWTALLNTHVIGSDGRCWGCRSQVGRGEAWPCTLHNAAARAQLIAGPAAADPRASAGG